MSKTKIAVSYEDGEVFQHFGHTKTFKIYHVEEKEILSSAVVSTGCFGHGALGSFLSQMGVQIVICGGIGGGAINALKKEGMQIYAGAEGDTDQCVADLLAGKIEQNTHANCSHHGDDHQCGSHGENHCQENHENHQCCSNKE